MKFLGHKFVRNMTYAALMSLPLTAVAQESQQHEHPGTAAAKPAPAPAPVKPPSAAKKAFEKMKTVNGEWEGTLTTTPTSEADGIKGTIKMKVTSMGNAMVHEVNLVGRKDNPITMFYIDSDNLFLTHYCDAGNRPRMVGKASPDGKQVEFELVDVAGDMKYHMHHSVFTFIDDDHHIEEWTFMVGDKPVLAKFDMHRKKTTEMASK